MSALEYALQIEREKYAQAQGLTPMQAGYLDVLQKLGYELKESAEPAMGPPAGAGKPVLKTPPGSGIPGPGASPPPAMAKGKGRGAPAGTGGFKQHVQKTLGSPGAAPAGPALGGRRSRSPLG